MKCDLRAMYRQRWYLHEGRVEERGAPETIFTNPSSERFASFIQTTH